VEIGHLPKEREGVRSEVPGMGGTVFYSIQVAHRSESTLKSSNLATHQSLAVSFFFWIRLGRHAVAKSLSYSQSPSRPAQVFGGQCASCGPLPGRRHVAGG
jgi:hypothetical protein